MIERRLLLEADTPGATLHSALAAGDRRGGTVLVIEARHRVVTGFATVDNMLPSSLGRYAVGLGLDVNSALGLGEERKSVGEGKRVSVRVDRGGSRIIKKKKK